MEEVVYKGEIYQRTDCSLVVNTWIPKKFLIINPQTNTYTDKFPNGYMVEDGLIPCYLTSFRETWSFFYSRNSYLNELCNYYVTCKAEARDKYYDEIAKLDKTFAENFLTLVSLPEFLKIINSLKNEGDLKIYTKGQLPEYLTFNSGNIYINSSDKLKINHEPQCNVEGKNLNNFPYSVSGWSKATVRKLTEDFEAEPLPSKVSAFGREAAKILSHLTWGIEWELSEGIFPNNQLCKTYTLPTTDGSLRRPDKYSGGNYTPPEYVTLPLAGTANIMKAVSYGCEAIQKFGSFNRTCSLHVHVGGQPLEKDFTIALMVLCQAVQKEVFTMYPLYKSDPSIVGINKNYSAPLPNRTKLPFHKRFLYRSPSKDVFHETLKEVFNRFFKFWSGGTDISEDYNVGNLLKGVIAHPQGRNKWDHKQRYHWINFMNYLFSKSRTIELRISPMTDDEDKVYALMLFLHSLIKYAQMNKVDLISDQKIKVSLNEVLEVLPKGLVRDTMIEYFKERKRRSFENDRNGQNEHLIKCPIIKPVVTPGKEQL
jgi:hypothetical protein